MDQRLFIIDKGYKIYFFFVCVYSYSQQFFSTDGRLLVLLKSKYLLEKAINVATSTLNSSLTFSSTKWNWKVLGPTNFPKIDQTSRFLKILFFFFKGFSLSDHVSVFFIYVPWSLQHFSDNGSPQVRLL